MKVDEYVLERVALYIGWHQSMLIKQYPSHSNINRSFFFPKQFSFSMISLLDKLFESLHDHAGASTAIVNEYSARGCLIKYDQDLYEDYFKLVDAYADGSCAIEQSNNDCRCR